MDNDCQSEVLYRKIKQRFLMVKNLPLSITTNDLLSLMENFHVDVIQISIRRFTSATTSLEDLQVLAS